MSDALSAVEQRTIFDERIRPVVFRHDPAGDAPSLVFLVGSPGASAGRAVGELAADSEIAVLSARDLRAFHPGYLTLSRSRSPEAQHVLTESATGWMRSALQHARTTRRSLVLEGAGPSPDVVLATTGLFASSGFTTTVAVVAVPRSESLLATASSYLANVRGGNLVPFTPLAEHDAGRDAVSALVEGIERSPTVDRLTIIGRDGTTTFDASRADPTGFSGAGDALTRGHATRLSAAESMRWLSELRAVTDAALSARRLAPPLGEVLITLHELGLNEILPNLPLPKYSQARPAAEAALGRQLVAIRQAVRDSARVEAPPAPVVAPPQPDRGISR